MKSIAFEFCIALALAFLGPGPAYAGQTEIVQLCYSQAELSTNSAKGVYPAFGTLCANVTSFADASQVIACYQKAVNILPSPKGIYTEFGILCANVKSESDTDAVINCYEKTLADSGKPKGAYQAFALLCSKVKN